MPNRVPIQTQFSFKCVKCGERTIIVPKNIRNIQNAVVHIRGQGWEHVAGLGAVCPDCLQKERV